MTKNNLNWADKLGNFLDGEELPDPYIVGDKSVNAFDVLVLLQNNLADMVSNNQKDQEYYTLYNLYNILTRKFFDAEVKRVFAPEFKPRFTEKLANEINQNELSK